VTTKYTFRSRTSWAAVVEYGGEVYTVRLARGQYKGKVFGNRYHRWNAEVRGPGVDVRFGSIKGATPQQLVTSALNREETA
jgi:hypothetical protein